MEKKIFFAILTLWLLLLFDFSGIALLLGYVIFRGSTCKWLSERFFVVQFVHVLMMKAYQALYVFITWLLYHLCDVSWFKSAWIETGMSGLDSMHDFYATFSVGLNWITIAVAVVFTVVYLASICRAKHTKTEEEKVEDTEEQEKQE